MPCEHSSLTEEERLLFFAGKDTVNEEPQPPLGLLEPSPPRFLPIRQFSFPCCAGDMQVGSSWL